MNSRTRFQNIALKILGVLLIAVGVNQLVGMAQSRWDLTSSTFCPFSHDRASNEQGPWNHRHRGLRINVDHDRTRMHDINGDVHIAMESMRQAMDDARRNMEEAHRERQEAMQDRRVEMTRFQ